MNLHAVFGSSRLMKGLEALAMSLMMGLSLGYLFFHLIFPQFCAPFQTRLSVLLILPVLMIFGLILGILLQDVLWTTIATFCIVILAVLSGFLIFISPGFSPDLINIDLTTDLLLILRLVFTYAVFSFLTIFVSSFFGMYVNDTYLTPDEDPFVKWKEKYE